MDMNRHALELAKRNGTLGRIKSHMVDELIGARYTVSEQIALLRQRDEKPEEYAAFYAFAEEAKARVSAILEAI